ncbi:MAG TPA: hypothetical protein VFN57_17045 [Thermomicrobiaceae bacterium]|nr:hypothetical protein [Thermomicrobiaceae bacterium]
MSVRTAGPSRWLYLLAAALVVAGAAIFTVLVVLPFNDMQRVTMPGTQQVTLTRSGTYTIVYEYRGSLHGMRYSAGQDYPDLTITVTNSSTGQPVPVSAVSHTLGQYTLGSRSGYSAAQFTVAQPGTYAVTATYPAGLAGPAFALGLVRATAGGVVGNLVLGILALVAGIAAGVLVTVVVFIRRLTVQPPRRTMEPTPAD